jgi:UDPglucose 6-dehydrogenase
VSNVVVIGTGYVGLTTGVCLAHLGNSVCCVDVDVYKIDRLQKGIVPIVEEGLANLLADPKTAEKISFSTDAVSAVKTADVVFLCVPTPQSEDGRADLSYIQAAVRTISKDLPSGVVIVNKSTVPVGSTKVVEQELRRTDVFVVSNPEFLREGSAVHDFLNPDRIVIGAVDQVAATKVAQLYENIEAPILFTDPASAETIKYAANAFLATKISFINSIAAICEGVGADIQDVALGIGYDQRIGHEFLRPGPGWGGSCFPKDTMALLQIAEDVGFNFDLLRGAIEANIQQHDRILKKVENSLGDDLRGRRIALWGLTFKANTDDLRDSPAIQIASKLLARGANLVAYDPTVHNSVPELDVEIVTDPIKATTDAESILLLTEWDEFRKVDVSQIANTVMNRLIVDTRNILNRSEWEQFGFTYLSIGR